ncbi:hypothetical protein ANN_16401 [Periplaneta americana]|uniref:SEFIR domain-containing protein n=1 Tax=Periplaneta americana TaxID=6978 RepID=A0ABQ8SIX8_PERAM|nr:hypothetical protein ANN_16401 [Periplaneta americana]
MVSSRVDIKDVLVAALRVRYQRREDAGAQQLCREVSMLRNARNPQLVLDCYWLQHVRASTEFTLEYEAVRPPHREVRKWVFQAPQPQASERSVQACGQAPLLYVDVSSLPVLVAYWRHAPPLWMDDWKYVVTVWDGHNLRDNTTFEGPFRVEAVLSFEFSTNSVPGVYHFEVTVLSNSCKAGVCHVSRSPDIVVGIAATEQKTLVVGIVGCVVFIPLFMFILLMWRRQCKPPNGKDVVHDDTKLTTILSNFLPRLKRQSNEWSIPDVLVQGQCTLHKVMFIVAHDIYRTTLQQAISPSRTTVAHRICPSPGTIKLPVVLIVYSPSRASHMATMVALAEYLRNYCAVEAMLDQLDVPETESKDPLLWCSSAFARADFVMVVSSPPKCSCVAERVLGGTNVDTLDVLKARITSHCTKPRFFAVLLPYSTDQNAVPEFEWMPTFRLTKDLDKLLWHVHSGGKPVTSLHALWVRFGPQLNGGRHDLQRKGEELLAAMQRADELLKICKCQETAPSCTVDIPDNVV